ncbi:MAG: prepilin-type N-terminal cleavage/methylation domain-containing protein [Gemmatimonadales bacterium]|jgi:type II secretion system protein G
METRKAGFTLIELLIVVVIIGILAAIAIPKFASTKEKAYIAAMKSDLRQLATAMEAYSSSAMSYTATYADLGIMPSTGVSTPTITLNADNQGWTGTVTHASTSVTCVIYVGSDATAAGIPDGTPQCS